MSRLADTYEGQVILDLHRDRSRSAAFVAGSARQVISQLARLNASNDSTTRLDEDAVGAEIAAAILFLIAERSTDAYEAARDIRAAGEPNPIRRALILALRRFAHGQFQEIAEVDLAAERLGALDYSGRAADLLFRELLKGLILLARSGLGIIEVDAIQTALQMFRDVRTLSLDSTVADDIGSGISATSVFAGPHHLAALLMRACDIFHQGVIVRTPTPGGSNNERWANWLQGEAKRWPFLWANHRDAIATGFLNRGSSLVMTTPTGSGKTTLAALKIAATLAADKTVLYLAPTHALVGQVERDLNERIVGLARAESIEDTLDETVQSLPDLAVITPERCFALLNFAPELFTNVGLMVFDECHLLGVARPGSGSTPPRVDRRSVDAMLCLLTFMVVNPGSDYLLLSAMVSNAEEVAEWLRSVLEQPVIAFDDRWKPTRQLRSCVTYANDDLTRLKGSLYDVRRTAPLAAIPYGLFSLAAGWNPGAPDKLIVRPFAPEPVPLNKGQNQRGRWITSNRYGVASVIADQLEKAGVKVIVFCESIPMCVSVAKNLNADREPFPSKRDADQDGLRKAALIEVGSTESIYDAGTTRAAVHHGELLPEERRLVESLFRDRQSGVNILAATSTLAQGLNLPCEAVILAGNDRLDDSDPLEKTRTPLMAHEVLNALGRAGRAGQAATGLSIVIPGNPIGCNLETKSVTADRDLKVIFSDGDQCIPLADPLTTLFDQVELAGVSGEEAQYLLRRLAISLQSEREGVETFEKLTRRSFGFHQRNRANTSAAEIWLASRKATLTAVLQAAAPPPSLPWQEELAAKTGASSKLIVKIASNYSDAPKTSVDAQDWIRWLLMQLDPADDDFDVFLRPETLGRVFGRAHAAQRTVLQRRRLGLAGILLVLEDWFRGKSLVELEQAIAAFIKGNEGAVSRPTEVDVKAKRARRFSLRLAPDLGFLCGLLNQVAQRAAADAGDSPPPMVGFLGQLVRRGFPTPYHFALSRDVGSVSRPDIQSRYRLIAEYLHRDPADDWPTIREKLTRAQMEFAISELPQASDVVEITLEE
jgi:superfamily II DNA/RNA helicase